MLRLLTHTCEMEDGNNVDLLLSRCPKNLEPNERVLFDNAIHLTPTWAEANRVMVHYLTHTLTGPIAKIHAILTSNKTRNCHLKKTTLPVYNALCPGGKVMLLTNFVVEQFIFNGSVGDLISIKYADPAGPNADEPKGYVIVDFAMSDIPEDKKLIPGMPRTCVPISMVKMSCENKCFEI